MHASVRIISHVDVLRYLDLSQSITILHGPINVLNEDAHVVHHQYPGAHWTQHPDLMRKHTKAYNGGLGSIFVGAPANR